MRFDKPAVLLVLAFVGAGIGLTHVYLARLEEEVSGGQPVAVLVAAEELPLGHTLTRDAMAVRDLPRAYVEERHIRAAEVSEVIGARLQAALRSGEAILWTDLSQFSDRKKSLSALIQNGMRAVAIESESTELETLMEPGDHVDVLLTTHDPSGKNVTVTLLQNLLVLSRGGIFEAEGAAESGAFAPRRRGGEGVTVSATMEQAQILTQAKRHGKLALTLRHPEDIARVDSVPETGSGDVLRAGNRSDWSLAPAGGRREIERVR